MSEAEKLTREALEHARRTCPPELRLLRTDGWHTCAEAKCLVRLHTGTHCFHHSQARRKRL